MGAIKNFKNTFICNSEKVFAFMVKHKWFNISKIPDTFISDAKFAAHAVKADGLVLQHLTDQLKDEFSIVLSAIKNNPESIIYASTRMQNDPEILYQAITSQPDLIQKFATRLVLDCNLRQRLFIFSEKLFNYLSDSYKKDKIFVLDLLNYNALVYFELDSKLKIDVDILKATLKKDYTLIGKIQDLFNKSNDPPKEDKNIIKEIKSKKNRSLSQDIKTSLDGIKGDMNELTKEIMIELIKSNSRVCEFVNKEFFKDRDNVIEVLKINGAYVRYMLDDHKDDIEIALIAINNNYSAYKHLSYRLKKDSTLLLVALKIILNLSINDPMILSNIKSNISVDNTSVDNIISNPISLSKELIPIWKEKDISNDYQINYNELYDIINSAPLYWKKDIRFFKSNFDAKNDPNRLIDKYIHENLSYTNIKIKDLLDHYKDEKTSKISFSYYDDNTFQELIEIAYERPDIIKYIPNKYKNNKEIYLKIITYKQFKTYVELKNINIEKVYSKFMSDKEVILFGVQYDILDFYHKCNKKYKNDIDILTQILRTNIEYYTFIPEVFLKKSKKNIDPSILLKNLSLELLKDKQVMLNIISISPTSNILISAPQQFIDDPDCIIAALHRSPEIYKFISDENKCNKDILKYMIYNYTIKFGEYVNYYYNMTTDVNNDKVVMINSVVSETNNLYNKIINTILSDDEIKKLINQNDKTLNLTNLLNIDTVHSPKLSIYNNCNLYINTNDNSNTTVLQNDPVNNVLVNVANTITTNPTPVAIPLTNSQDVIDYFNVVATEFTVDYCSPDINQKILENPALYHDAPDDIKSNKILVMQLLMKIGKEDMVTFYKHIPDSLKNMLDITSVALKISSETFEFIPMSFRSQFDIARRHILLCPKMFKHIAGNLKSDIAISTKAIIDDADNFEYLHESYKSNAHFLTNVVSENINLYDKLNEKMQKDINIVKSMLNKDPSRYTTLDISLQKNPDIAEIAIKADRNYLRNAPQEIKLNPKFR